MSNVNISHGYPGITLDDGLPGRDRLHVHQQRRPGRRSGLQLQRRHPGRELVHRDRADQGGAIGNDGSLTASGDRFTGNRAREVGGVAYTTEGLALSDSALVQNEAGHHGGAIYLALPFFTSSVPLTVTGTTIAGNVAGKHGGGLHDAVRSRALVTLTGTVVAGNHPDNCAPAGSVADCTPARRGCPG